MNNLNRILYSFATLGFIGFIPLAPGTFGTAAAWLVILLWRPSDFSLFIAFMGVVSLGMAAAHTAEKLLGKDSGHIVIDEVCGYIVSVLYVPKTLGCLFGAFLLFRFFDILKPPPIRKVEHLAPGGAGIMLDDIVAGIYANISLQILVYLFAGTEI